MLKKMTIVIMLLGGCAQVQVKTNTGAETEMFGFQPNNGMTRSSRIDISRQTNARVAYLQKRILAHGGNLREFHQFDSLFSLVRELEDGLLNTEELNGRHFYFGDDFIDGTSHRHVDSTFECIQVIRLEDIEVDGRKEKMHSCLYYDFRVHTTVMVIWVGIIPREGQHLNTDYLIFLEAGSYEAKGGGDRNYIKFIRPRWAGENGARFDGEARQTSSESGSLLHFGRVPTKVRR
ncbi:MAG: hypothetical protein ACE5FY_02340 [Nitrospiria bacterium]